eukprot:165372-Rhodomonas_salina.5
MPCPIWSGLSWYHHALCQYCTPACCTASPYAGSLLGMALQARGEISPFHCLSTGQGVSGA